MQTSIEPKQCQVFASCRPVTVQETEDLVVTIGSTDQSLFNGIAICLKIKNHACQHIFTDKEGLLAVMEQGAHFLRLS